MLNYFPSIYPGELLYSVIARLHAHLGAPPWMSTLDMLFGRRMVVADPDLPGALNALCQRLPAGRHLCIDRLIDKTTQFSYYTAFQPPKVQRWARDRMRSGDVAGLHIKLGLLAFRAGCIKRLRYCPCCLADMAMQYGEYYWRREHQLPGVLVCPIHAVPLRESSVGLSRCSRHAYVWPDDDNCSPCANDLVSPDAAARGGTLWWLATASADLLEARTVPRAPVEWTAFYRKAMDLKGLTHSPRRMNQEALDAAMRERYGDTLRLLPGVMDGDRFQGDWLAAMVRTQRRAIHPLRHLLLQGCLDRLTPPNHPFGGGPWPCPSPLHGAGYQNAVTTCQTHGNHGHRVGVFACRCGYAFTRTYSASSDKRGPARFLTYGPRLRPVLKGLVQSKCSLREIGRQLHLDPSTVVRLARQIGVRVPWKVGRHRVRALRAPQAAIVSPRSGSATPDRAASVSTTHRWQALDTALRERIAAVAQGIRERVPPIRVSIAEVERELGIRGWLSKRKSKLPETISMLNSVVESISDFQRRRVAAIVREGYLTARPLQPWRVMRRAGLTARHLPMIDQVLASDLASVEIR